MKPFTRILLGISILCLAACKKEKQFGEKYPNFTGKWECTAAHIIEYRAHVGGLAYPALLSNTEITEINLSGNAYGIHPHILEISVNGKYKLYTSSLIIEQGRIAEVFIHYPDSSKSIFKNATEKYKEYISCDILKKNIQNSFYHNADSSVIKKVFPKRVELYLSYVELIDSSHYLSVTTEGGAGNFRDVSTGNYRNLYSKFIKFYYRRI